MSSGLASLRSLPRLDLICLAAAAAMLLTLALTMASLVNSGTFGYDFAAYHNAGVRVAHGLSPYDPMLLHGAIDAKGAGNYLYPPPFAQALALFAAWPLRLVASIWVVIQAGLLLTGLWLAARAGGSERKSLLAVGVVALVITSLPALGSLLEGNVAGLTAFAVALAVAAPWSLRAGAGLALAGIVKLAPAALLLPLGRSGRRAWIAATAVVAAVVGTSYAIAPAAWHDWMLVLRGLSMGNTVYEDNLAPAAAASLVGLTDLAGFLSSASPVAGILLIGAAWFIARRRPVTALGVALAGSWLVPGVCWPHYLVPLLPIIAYAWGGAGHRQRAGFVACLILLSLSPLATPFAWAGVVGALVLVAVVESREAILAMPMPKREPVLEF